MTDEFWTIYVTVCFELPEAVSSARRQALEMHLVSAGWARGREESVFETEQTTSGERTGFHGQATNALVRAKIDSILHEIGLDGVPFKVLVGDHPIDVSPIN